MVPQHASSNGDPVLRSTTPQFWVAVGGQLGPPGPSQGITGGEAARRTGVPFEQLPVVVFCFHYQAKQMTPPGLSKLRCASSFFLAGVTGLRGRPISPKSAISSRIDNRVFSRLGPWAETGEGVCSPVVGWAGGGGGRGHSPAAAPQPRRRRRQRWRPAPQPRRRRVYRRPVVSSGNGNGPTGAPALVSSPPPVIPHRSGLHPTPSQHTAIA